MMLDWLGHRHDDATAREAAAMIESAVVRLLKSGRLKTPDQGGNASTSDIAEAVAWEISQGGVLCG